MFSSTATAAELKIRLQHPRGRTWYIPGDTIIGTVVRTTPGVAPDVKVTLTLQGQSESKIKRRQGQNNTRRYKSTLNMLSGPNPVQILQLEGPLHIPPGGDGASWPFAITIPAHVRDIRHQFASYSHFMQPGAVDGAGEGPYLYTPPPTFAYGETSGLGSDEYSCHIEYFLQAKIELSHQHKGRTKKDYKTTNAHFQLKNVSPDPPIIDYNMYPAKFRQGVSTYRLVPGIEELTLGQKTRMKLGWPDVPRLAFNIKVRLPHTLQTENTNVIPFYISAEAIQAGTSEILHHVPQRIKIESFTIRIKSSVTIKAEKKVSSGSMAKRVILPARAMAGRDIYLDLTPGAAEAAPINLGDMLEFRLDPKLPFQPTFQTYNVSLTHHLVWEMEGSVAGKKFKVEARHPLRMVPRSFMPVGAANAVPVAQPVKRAETVDEYLPVYTERAEASNAVSLS